MSNTNETLIQVDRSAEIEYPGWVRSWEYPKYHQVGPSEFDICSNVRLRQHETRRDDGFSKASSIHAELARDDLIDSCLGLDDGYALQKINSELYSRVFGEETYLFLWRSLARDLHGALIVSYIYLFRQRIALGWRELTQDVGRNYRSAHFV